jgi:hypothetical protein
VRATSSAESTAPRRESRWRCSKNGTDKVYVLLPNKDKQPLPDGLINKMGSEVTVTGKVQAKGGSTFLTVESFK